MTDPNQPLDPEVTADADARALYAAAAANDATAAGRLDEATG